VKINKWSKDKPKNTKQTYKCQESKTKEKTSHPAKERITPAHAPPGLTRGRPFFIFGPPGRALMRRKVMAMFHFK
jgi:hypothetical protein